MQTSRVKGWHFQSLFATIRNMLYTPCTLALTVIGDKGVKHAKQCQGSGEGKYLRNTVGHSNQVLLWSLQGWSQDVERHKYQCSKWLNMGRKIFKYHITTQNWTVHGYSIPAVLSVSVLNFLQITKTKQYLEKIMCCVCRGAAGNVPWWKWQSFRDSACFSHLDLIYSISLVAFQ